MHHGGTDPPVIPNAEYLVRLTGMQSAVAARLPQWISPDPADPAGRTAEEETHFVQQAALALRQGTVEYCSVPWYDFVGGP